jgi:hypothetical protein
MRVAEDSRSAPLFTAARDANALRNDPEVVSLSAFQHSAELYAALAQRVAALTPPDYLRSHHNDLVTALRREADGVAAARDTAATGDTDGALRKLVEAQAQFERDLKRSGRPPMFGQNTLLDCLG